MSRARLLTPAGPLCGCDSSDFRGGHGGRGAVCSLGSCDQGRCGRACQLPCGTHVPGVTGTGTAGSGGNSPTSCGAAAGGPALRRLLTAPVAVHLRPQPSRRREVTPRCGPDAECCGHHVVFGETSAPVVGAFLSFVLVRSSASCGAVAACRPRAGAPPSAGRGGRGFRTPVCAARSRDRRADPIATL